MSKKKRKPQQRTRQTQPKPKADIPALAAAFKKFAATLEEAKKKQDVKFPESKAWGFSPTPNEWPKFDNRIGAIPDPDERYGLGFPAVEGSFSAPDETVTQDKSDRIQWYWRSSKEEPTVIASYIKQDSVYTEDVVMGAHGARKGDWVIDVVSPSTTLFTLTPEQAKWLAGALLSAVGWESIWRKHYVDPEEKVSEIYEDNIQKIVKLTKKEEIPLPSEGGDMPKGFDDQPLTEFKGDDPFNNANKIEHRCCIHCDQEKDIHAPHTSFNCYNDPLNEDTEEQRPQGFWGVTPNVTEEHFLGNDA